MFYRCELFNPLYVLAPSPRSGASVKVCQTLCPKLNLSKLLRHFAHTFLNFYRVKFGLDFRYQSAHDALWVVVK